jgi:hypothetical protein
MQRFFRRFFIFTTFTELKAFRRRICTTTDAAIKSHDFEKRYSNAKKGVKKFSPHQSVKLHQITDLANRQLPEQ